jgi:hypothetical protein
VSGLAGKAKVDTGLDSDSSSDASVETANEISDADIGCLSPEELMTLPSRLAGYSLVTKDIGFLRVDHLFPVQLEVEKAQALRKTSKTIQAILDVASGFKYTGAKFDYTIGGKGKGLVILLYGASGTGKTLTAGKAESAWNYWSLCMLISEFVVPQNAWLIFWTGHFIVLAEARLERIYSRRREH